MAPDQGSGAGTVLLAFLVGAVAGAAVALLYAPASGQETREFLNEKAREGARRASEAARVGRDVIKDVYEQVKAEEQT
jgi:gas vesicle protein